MLYVQQKIGSVTGLITVLYKNCLLKDVFAGKLEVKTVADGKTMRKMKATTELT